MKNFIQIFLFVLLLSGCATYGTKITDEMVSGITVGETTKQELHKILGKPLSRSLRSDGDEIYTWGFYDTNLISGKSQNKALSVVLENDVVKDYTYTDINNPL